MEAIWHHMGGPGFTGILTPTAPEGNQTLVCITEKKIEGSAHSKIVSYYIHLPNEFN